MADKAKAQRVQRSVGDEGRKTEDIHRVPQTEIRSPAAHRAAQSYALQELRIATPVCALARTDSYLRGGSNGRQVAAPTAEGRGTVAGGRLPPLRCIYGRFTNENGAPNLQK